MTDLEAWGLKPGECVVCLNTYTQVRMEGRFLRLIDKGLTQPEACVEIAKYDDLDFTDLGQLMQDPPVLMIQCEDGERQWRYSFVHHLKHDFGHQCRVCGAMTPLNLRVRDMIRWKDGMPPHYLFEGEEETTQLMIQHGLCKRCLSVRPIAC